MTVGDISQVAEPCELIKMVLGFFCEVCYGEVVSCVLSIHADLLMKLQLVSFFSFL